MSSRAFSFLSRFSSSQRVLPAPAIWRRDWVKTQHKTGLSSHQTALLNYCNRLDVFTLLTFAGIEQDAGCLDATRNINVLEIFSSLMSHIWIFPSENGRMLLLQNEKSRDWSAYAMPHMEQFCAMVERYKNEKLMENVQPLEPQNGIQFFETIQHFKPTWIYFGPDHYNLAVQMEMTSENLGLLEEACIAEKSTAGGETGKVFQDCCYWALEGALTKLKKIPVFTNRANALRNAEIGDVISCWKYEQVVEKVKLGEAELLVGKMQSIQNQRLVLQGALLSSQAFEEHLRSRPSYPKASLEKAQAISREIESVQLALENADGKRDLLLQMSKTLSKLLHSEPDGILFAFDPENIDFVKAAASIAEGAARATPRIH